MTDEEIRKYNEAMLKANVTNRKMLLDQARALLITTASMLETLVEVDTANNMMSEVQAAMFNYIISSLQSHEETIKCHGQISRG
jgi:hypothetical protein